MKKLYSFLLIIGIFFSVSCSLNYLNSENSEASIPEFCFKNASYTKYEASKKNVSLKAEQLEQYKSDNAVFAKNAVFETYDTDGKEDTAWKKVFVYQHFSMNRFLVDLNDFQKKNMGTDLPKALEALGHLHRDEIFSLASK